MSFDGLISHFILILNTIALAESEEKPNSLNVKEESEKAGLKLNIQIPKPTASSPIISRQMGKQRKERQP